MIDTTKTDKKQPGKKKSLTIVGIGASAGGLNALKEFFRHVREDSGLAYVIVVHLSPEHKSVLAELLQPHIKMPIWQVKKSEELKPNHVYVIPPNANLKTIDTHLRLSQLEKNRSERAPIDYFFRTLGKNHGKNSIGVILTGTGSDGTLGIKEIKAYGGLAIVQDPMEAEYDGMPRSAIASGIIDLILPLKEIPTHIISYAQTTPRISFLQKGKEPGTEENKLVQKILAQLRARTGRDFSRYKLSTIIRRMERRMQIYQVEELIDYLELLRKNPEEAQTLSDDFLINVTSFFRDKQVFEYLGENIIPKILKKRKPDEQVRVWSVGCSTGEEAYSLAIMFMEAVKEMDTPPSVQIFASDLHEVSLKKAREGFFPGDIKADVSSDRLTRFFTREDGGYRIRKELREMVIFTPHNLLNDPPFSKLDMLVCRNLLIYLQKGVQKDVFELMHYSLLPNSYLILGPSESIDNAELFSVENKDISVYIRKNVDGPEPRLPVFPKIRSRTKEEISEMKPADYVTVGEMHHKLVERFGPPSLLLSTDYQLIHVSETAGRYLQMPGGQPSRDIFRLIRKEMALELRTAIHASKENKKSVRSLPIHFSIDGIKKQVFLSARVIEESSDEAILVMFEEYDEPLFSVQKIKVTKTNDLLIKRTEILEKELSEKRQQVQTVIEEYETSREEMKASNEELQSANEELRSTMEELETSKEELQSVNEELTTLNQENRHKVEELSQLSDDLQNLLAATDIATLFINRDLRIMRYTPKLSELFNIRPADHGRPISDITNRLGYNLVADAKKVLDKLLTIENEISDERNNFYLTRLMPYRSSEDKIDGVVITFIDITERKHSEIKIKKSEERFRAMANTMFNMLYRMNPDWSEMIELEGKNFLKDLIKPDKNWMDKYVPPDDQQLVTKAILQAVKNKKMFALEHRVIRVEGNLGWIVSRAIPLLDEKGEIREWIGAAMDITEHKEAEHKLQKEKKYAESIIETLHEPLLVLNPDFTVRSANAAFYNGFKIKAKETIGQLVFNLDNSQWNIPELKILLQDVMHKNAVIRDFEIEHNFEFIGRKVMLLNARRLENVEFILLGIRDITDRKQHEERMEKMLNVEQVGVLSIADDKLQFANDIFLKMVGYSRKEFEKEKLGWRDFTPEEYIEISEKQMEKLHRVGKIGPYEKEYFKKDGSRIWLMFAGASMGDGTFIEYCIDVTEKKKAERELLASRTEYKTLFESIDEGFCIIEMDYSAKNKQLDYRFLKINSAFEKQSGLKNVEGKTMRDLVPNHENYWFETYNKVAETGKAERFIQKAKFINGKSFDVYAFKIGKAEERRVAVLFKDITQALKDEEELKLAKEAAEEAARIREEFLAHMSHEIRTPLNSIVGLAHLLKELPHDKIQEENLNNLKTASENLHELISDILDYSKLRAGKWKLNNETISLKNCIDDLVIIHMYAANARNISLKTEYNENIPEKIITDETKLMHVLNNLLSNALKFTNKGEVRVEVRLSRRKHNKLWLLFSVTDTGIGIEKKHLKHIFREFSQADQSAAKLYKGTGLGLSIVKMYLEILGSEINVESEVGKGSSFWFELLVREAGENKVVEENTEEQQVKLNANGARLLVVEDDDFSRKMLGQMLTLWNLKHDDAFDGKEAVEMAKKNSYDIIFMDLHMPEMDGVAATTKIRKIKDYKNKTIFALTADVTESVNKYVSSGLFNGKIIKPFDPEKLLAEIRTILSDKKPSL